MPSIIEIDNEKIKIVQTAKKRRQYHVIRFKEYAGNVNDEQQCMELIKRINETRWRFGKTILLVNHGSVLYREMKLPKLQPKKMRSVIANEIKASMGQTETILCDYLELSEAEEGKNRVLTCSITKTALETAMGLAQECGAKLKRIDAGYNALFNYLDATEIKDKKDPYLVIEVEQRQARLFLFDEGQFILVRNVRLPYLDELTQTGEMLAAEVSRMNQFQLSRHYQAEIKNVYLFGEHDQLSSILEYSKDRMAIDISFLPEPQEVVLVENFNYLNYVYALGALAGK